MLIRSLFVVFFGFWIVMNVLLWRSEYGTAALGRNSIQPARVWEKIITAPDHSTMDVLYRGRRIGFARWTPNVGQATSTAPALNDEEQPEGMVSRVSDYTVDFDGSVRFPGSTNHARFDLKMKFSTDHAWKDFALRVGLRPMNWYLTGDAAAKTFGIEYDGPQGALKQTFTQEQLNNPKDLLSTLSAGSPNLPGISDLFSGVGKTPDAGTRPRWQAATETIHYGSTPIRVYQLRGQLTEEHRVTVIVSRAGELIKIQLPGDIVLKNEAFHFVR